MNTIEYQLNSVMSMNYKIKQEMSLDRSQLSSLLTNAISNFTNDESISIGPNHFVQVFDGKCNWHIPYVNRKGDSKNILESITSIIDEYKQHYPNIVFDI